MEEKLLKTKKNGMAVLLLVIAAIAADFALVILSCTIWGTAEHPFLPLFIPTLILLCVSWILFLGFKVLKPQEALVVAVGPGEETDGKKTPMQVKEGDKVIYTEYAGTEVKFQDEEYIIVDQKDIIAIVE